ncbi:collagen Mcl1 protein [Rutstroemia sp. NJR-2017a BVV2]|nr:collagen Mcl1 protein [Rutstroemia sp. NJR-2017a BVV2]
MNPKMSPKMSFKINFAFPFTMSIALFAGLSVAQDARVPHPNSQYLSEMCYPLLTNITRTIELNITVDEQIPSLVNSPFPCEQANYILQVCSANGTTPIDFLAEQECLCPSSYWVAVKGCVDCFLVHGYLNETQEEDYARISSLSSAECLATSPPIQPYSNLLYTTAINVSTVLTAPDDAIGTDRFPNQTAVSNYFTSTGTNMWTVGTITGSATARLTSFTNSDGVRFTPTATIASTGSGSATSAAASSKSSSPAKRLEMTRASAFMGVLGMAILL